MKEPKDSELFRPYLPPKMEGRSAETSHASSDGTINFPTTKLSTRGHKTPPPESAIFKWKGELLFSPKPTDET